MKQLILIPALSLGLAGCAGLDLSQFSRNPSAIKAPTSDPQSATEPLSAIVVPPSDAITVEEFDTTTSEQREAAAASAPLGAGALGKTVASLGDVVVAGFWLETPLVSEVKEGRVKSSATGRTVKVQLKPISGPDGAGSRISLAALRLLDLSMTGLHEVEVYVP